MKFKVSDYLSNLDNQVFGKQILYIPSTKSTNDEIWNHFINNDHLIVVTDNQTAGRGQRGNIWASKKYKSLTFSIGLLDDKKNSALLSLKSALAVSNAILKSTGILAYTKWPNDILIKNKKVAGILIESKGNNNRRLLNIGIGINVNGYAQDFPESIKNSSITLQEIYDKPIQREPLLACILNELDNLIENSAIKELELINEIIEIKQLNI